MALRLKNNGGRLLLVENTAYVVVVAGHDLNIGRDQLFVQVSIGWQVVVLTDLVEVFNIQRKRVAVANQRELVVEVARVLMQTVSP